MQQLELGIPPVERRPRSDRVVVAPPPSRQLGLFESASPSPTEPSSGPRPSFMENSVIQGQARVERFLRQLLGPRVLVQLTQNRSTMISYSVKKGVRYVRLHTLFAHAPDHILGAVAQFVSTKKPGPKTVWLIDQWIEIHRPYVTKQGRKPRVLPKGEVHDLQSIFDTLNETYFRGRVQSKITWSTAARKQKRTSIRMGSYSEHEQLIRIHPALDQTFVPEFFVASVVFHEMLHELHGALETADGIRRVHTPAFRRDEARFPDYAKARAWEAKNLHRLLNY